MTSEQISSIIIAAGLDPGDYQIAHASAIVTTWIDEEISAGMFEGLTTADFWEILAGERDETVPRTRSASEAAWAIADCLDPAVGYGGYLVPA